MSKQPSSGDQKRADDRLVKAFRVSKKMRPFASRMRMRIDSLDLTDPARASQFARSREEMRSILAKKKIPKPTRIGQSPRRWKLPRTTNSIGYVATNFIR